MANREKSFRSLFAIRHLQFATVIRYSPTYECQFRDAGLSRASTSLQRGCKNTWKNTCQHKPGGDEERRIMSTSHRSSRYPSSFRDPIALCRWINGLRMHVLEARFETKGRPCVLLLHGFPELAYLAQRDAGAGGSRLSRDRAGPVRLWPHHRLEIRLRSQSQSIPAAQSGARWCGRTYSDRSR